MRKPTRLTAIFLALVVAALACNFPGVAPAEAPGALLTYAAETLQAQASPTPTGESGVDLSPTPQQEQVAEIPTDTVGVPPSPTMGPLMPPTSAPPLPAGPPTNTPVPCNLAQFVTDVTYPDGAPVVAGTSFVKTWRLRNIGTCTWTSAYQLVFDKGERMGGPVSQPLPGNVAPGQEVDISVTLTAPPTPGKYKGFWRLRDPGGVIFGITTGSFWVEIKSVAATAAPPPTATFTPTPIVGFTLVPPVLTFVPILDFVYNAPLIPGESGSVRSNGGVSTTRNVGDTNANLSQQAFVSFDLSGLPAGVVVKSVSVNFSDYDTLGSPFSLGCLRMYPQNYGSVDPIDFFSGSASGAVVRWCDLGELSNTSFAAPDLKSFIQSAVGSARVRFRLQFNETATNNNGTADMVRFGTGLKLIIVYNFP